jgi:hypothetical protein
MARSKLNESHQTLALGSESAPTKAIPDRKASDWLFRGRFSPVGQWNRLLPAGRSLAEAHSRGLNSLRIIWVRNAG